MQRISDIPETQAAVQLIGPDELTLNTEKTNHLPGPYQVLAKVEAVGLCFSDLKLLKQFHEHARKGHIVSGIDDKTLSEIPSYVPDDQLTVPGHEAVVRVVAMGDKTKDVKVGSRYLIQTDYRWLPTENSNASFGYNFEGGLQQYVLMDQRVTTSPEGESLLIPASEELSASAVALVEPWACVEDSYVAPERYELKAGGNMLVHCAGDLDEKLFVAFLARFGKPGKVTFIGRENGLGDLDIRTESFGSVEDVADMSFDDVVYYGNDAKIVESIFPKLGPRGLLNIVQCGGRFECDVVSQVGRVHYGGIRIVGTTGSNPADSMEYIPHNGEIRQGDVIDVVGAAGPMGVMHVIRNICQGVKDVTVLAGDLDTERIAALDRITIPIAAKHDVAYRSYNPSKNPPTEPVDYVAIMVPVPQLVAAAVTSAAPKGVINIFAGIPANVSAAIDLNAYIEKQLYFIGTSGSVLDDMKAVLAKVESYSLETDISVAAICGLAASIEGIRAVENRLIPGKILVYPSSVDLPLITLDKLGEHLPEVAAKLKDGLWNIEAEKALLAQIEN
ncbi:MAG: alcohol dehydrogenase catalytic domain-containing protein [Anaerohalosphaera sp.]|nr:alcohol dehydrogenase catalytic domain-containing protein [Anaerohalosphaera sp.]